MECKNSLMRVFILFWDYESSLPTCSDNMQKEAGISVIQKSLLTKTTASVVWHGQENTATNFHTHKKKMALCLSLPT